MKAYSTKAYLKSPDKTGLSRLHIRYTYKRVPHSISLNIKLEPVKFDSSKGLVKTKYNEASTINFEIRQAQQLIEDVANNLPNPTFQEVKRQYENRLSEIAEQKKELENETVITERKVKITNLTDYIESLELPEQLEYHKNKIIEIEARQRELNKKGFKNNEYEENQIKKYLDEYPARFSSQSDSTVSHIKSWSRTLLKFAEDTNTTLSYNAFDYTFYNSYARYLMFDSKEHQYFNNNFGNHVKKLKGFLKWLEEEKDITINKGYKKFKALKEDKEIIYLSENELNLLWDYKPETKPEYQKYIDLCVFGNLTGLRFSDIKRSYWKIENDMLVGLTKKTKGNYNIPLCLDTRIEEILKAYNYNLNLVSEVNYNVYIKKICKSLFEKHDINKEPITIRRERLKEEYFFKYQKYELISSHSSRRGFCTRLWQQGYDEQDILLMTGSKSSEVLRKYIKNSPEDMLRKATVKQAEKAKTEATVANLDLVNTEDLQLMKVS